MGAGGLARQLLRRIARAHAGAPEVARAVAILEPHAEIGAVAELAGLDSDNAACAGDSPSRSATRPWKWPAGGAW